MVPLGKTIEPELITPFTITAFVTVVVPKFELVIVEPVPNTVTFERVEPETVALVRVLLATVEPVTVPPDIVELVEVAPEREVFVRDPPETNELLFTVEPVTVAEESVLWFTVLPVTVTEVSVEVEIVLPVIVDRDIVLAVVVEFVTDDEKIVLPVDAELARVVFPVMPSAVDEAVVGAEKLKYVPFTKELVIVTDELVIINGPMCETAEALPALSSAFTWK